MIIERLPTPDVLQHVQQRAVSFLCQSCWLVSVLSVPQQPLRRGVLIVTGGPQYRVGSHRQFALLAQELAGRGIPVMRFDYRGMGDSEGAPRNYAHIGDDIDSAVRTFFSAVPALSELVIWGLCDGATAAACHAAREPRIKGLILLNPWVRTEPGLARATLRHYYLARLGQGEFWRKLLSGGVRMKRSLAHLRSLQRAGGAAQGPADDAASAPQRLLRALSQFRGRTLVILSGDDLGAREFSSLQADSAQWRAVMANPALQRVDVPHANHTFARREWRDNVTVLCASWIASW